MDRSRVDIVQGIWGRSVHFGQNGGWDKFRRARVFLCGNPWRSFGNFSTADFHEIWSRNVVQCPVDESGKTFQTFSLYGSFAPKIWNRKSVKQAPHSEQVTSHGMHCREILFTPRSSPRAREFPRSGQLAQIPPMANGYYTMLLHGASDLDKRCLKTRNSEDGCTFPPNIFAPTPKITPKPHFVDLSMRNLLQRELSVSRTLMELQSWNFTVMYTL